MNVLLTLFQQYIEFSSNPYLIIPIQIVSFVILSRIIANFVSLRLSQKKFNYEKTLFIFFIIPIVAIMIDNVFLIVKFIIPKTPLCRSINCLAWIFSGIKFHSLILFLEQLIHKKISWNSYHKLFFALEFLMCCAFIMNTVRAILYNESYYFVITFYYIIVLFSFISIIITILKQLSNQNIPIVLKQQIKTLLIFFLCPHFICTLLELLPIVVFGKAQILAFLNIGIILITASIYFCFKKIMQFRFLNHSDHVQAQPKINITTNFKDAIEQINVACNEQELEYIAQQFFTEQFSIPKQQITLYVRSNHETQKELQQQIETFLTTEYPDFNPIEMLLKHKILVNHEIEFDEFYTDNQMIVTLSKFLRSIQCDIFLPIINNKKLLGYITVQTQPTPTLYNFDQQNKMMVFAKFLAPAMYMLQQQNTYTLLQETKEIKEELYEKQQEINQYKESIKQLLKDRVEHHIGIIFYKGKHFAFKNQEAQTLLTINPNLETDHPTTATLINFAQQIEKFQTTQNMYLPMHDGSKIMISGMPQPHNDGGVLLIVRKPEATDLIKMHIDALKNPSQRDYLLYLETTKVGQCINKLLPSNHETFLNIKIQLLQAALQKSALLLQMHLDDINTMVNIIHELSGAQTLQIIDLHPGHQVTAATIFGINPLLNQQQEQALLEKLVNGTLLIKNIEYADHITQQKLAHMMRYGIYTPVKSEQRKFSDTRVICSTSQNLDALHHEGIIVSDLYQELSRHHLALPSLVTMDSLHISELIDGFMYQNLQKPGSSHLRALNYKDKQALIDKHIASLFALQQKVYTLMSMKAHEAASKAQEKNIPAKTFDTTSPELKLAAQLGKHALKDIQLMKTLWKRLGNQTKIADLLGVNRSSVNRRCKEYNLI